MKRDRLLSIYYYQLCREKTLQGFFKSLFWAWDLFEGSLKFIFR